MLPRLTIFIIWLLALSTACSAQPAKGTSDKKPAAAKTQKDPKIWLNREAMGSLNDPSKLEATIKKIIERREKNADYIESTPKQGDLVPPPQLKDGVYLLVAPDVSVGDFKKVYELLDEHCTLFVPRSDVKEASQEPRPNPFLLVVSVGASSVNSSKVAHLEDFDSEGKYSYDMFVFPSADAGDLWFDRIFGAIEIRPDGSYIVNERYENVDQKKPLDAYPPKQRPAKSSLKEEVAKLMRHLDSGKNTLSIIASASAPYKSLDEILKLAEELKLHFEIRVDLTR